MAQATSISVSKFTTAVQAAVKAALQKHPKFKIDPPTQVAVDYLIRGIPADAILATATLSEAQAFAADVASHLSSGAPEVFAAAAVKPEGAVYARGGHVILGFPAVSNVVLER